VYIKAYAEGGFSTIVNLEYVEAIVVQEYDGIHIVAFETDNADGWLYKGTLEECDDVINHIWKGLQADEAILDLTSYYPEG